MMRVALFCNDDLTTNIIFAPVFDVPGIEIAGVYFVKHVNREHKGLLSGTWAMRKKMDSRYWFYLVATNGLFKLFELLTLKLGLPARNGYLVSLRRLTQLHQVPVEHVEDFADPAFIARMQSLKLDLLLIRVGAILTPEMLAVPKRETWCVHSSLLPAFKGIAGEFHALRTPGAPIGSTVFRVTPRLDEGPPIAQTVIVREEHQSVFHHMLRNNEAASALLAQMLQHLQQNVTVEYALPGQHLPSSYFSWPQSHHTAEARSRGITLITLREWLKLSLQALRLSH